MPTSESAAALLLLALLMVLVLLLLVLVSPPPELDDRGDLCALALLPQPSEPRLAGPASEPARLATASACKSCCCCSAEYAAAWSLPVAEGQAASERAE